MSATAVDLRHDVTARTGWRGIHVFVALGKLAADPEKLAEVARGFGADDEQELELLVDWTRSAIFDLHAKQLILGDFMPWSQPFAPGAHRGWLEASHRVGMLALDHMACAALEAVGATGVAHARRIREKSRRIWSETIGEQTTIAGLPEPSDALWRLWVDDCRQFVGLLLDAMLVDRVRPELERREKAARSPCPAIVRGVQLELAAARTEGVSVAFTSDGAKLVTPGGVAVARFSAIPKSSLDLIRIGAEVFPRVMAERVVRELVQRVWWQLHHPFELAFGQPYTRLIYAGGFEGLAQACGLNHRDRAQLPALLEAFQAYRGGRRDIPPFGMFWLDPAAPGRRAELRLDVGEALVPGFKPGFGRPYNWLLPALPIPSLPNGVDNRDRGRLYDLQWELLNEFRSRLGDIETGWALGDCLPRASDRSGVGLSTAERAAEHWGVAEDAWLKAMPGDRVTLADDRALELYRLAKADAEAKRHREQAARFRRKGAR